MKRNGFITWTTVTTGYIAADAPKDLIVLDVISPKALNSLRYSLDTEWHYGQNH